MLILTTQSVTYAGTTAELETALDSLMDALLALEAADTTLSDPDLGATITGRQVDVMMTIDADDTMMGLNRASAALGAAVHSIGGFTPSWQISTATVHAGPAEDPDLITA
jgi:hypothetical protein